MWLPVYLQTGGDVQRHEYLQHNNGRVQAAHSNYVGKAARHPVEQNVTLNKAKEKDEAIQKEKKNKLNVHLITLVCKQVKHDIPNIKVKVFLFFRLLPLRNPFVVWTSR